MLQIAHQPRNSSRSVLLRCERAHPRFSTRAIITLVLSPFLVLSLLIPQDAFSEPGVSVFHRCVAVGFMLLAYASVLGLWWLAGALTGRWTRIHWNADEQALEATFHGSWLWIVRTWRIPFREIQEVSFCFGIDGEKEAAVPVSVRYAPPGGPVRTLDLPLLVSGLNLRGEAMDLAFRMAHAMRWKGYRVRRSDHLKLEVELLPSQGGEAVAIPEPGAASRYEIDEVSPGIEAPEPTFPAFVPERFEGPASIREWLPGQIVRLEKVPVPRGKAAALVAAWMALITVPVFGALYFYGNGPMGALLLIPALEAPLFGGVVMYLVHKRARERRDVTLDWRVRRLGVRDDRGAVEYPLDDIRRLAVRGSVVLCSETVGDDRRSYHEYQCEVVGCLTGGGEVQIAQTHRSRDGNIPYLACASMTTELAAALDVPWQWDDYRSP